MGKIESSIYFLASDSGEPEEIKILCRIFAIPEKVW